VDGVLFVGSDCGVLYAFGGSQSTNNTATPTPIPTTNSYQPTVQATTQNGTTINLTLNGNITSSQISNLTISISANTTIVSFTLTGENGTAGFSNMTLPNNALPNAANPTIYIDNQLALDQGYTEDADNYYIWYTTHFSTHQISIQFSNGAVRGGVEGEANFIQIIYGVAVALVIVISVAVVLKLVAREKKKNQ
jgi:hypothetical protein